MTNKFILWLSLALLFISSQSIWAGDIKPLQTCIQTGLFQRSLGVAATAKDKYRVTCPVGTRSFQAQVRDRVPVANPVLRIIVTASNKAGSSGGIRPDYVDGNGGTSQCDLTGFSSPSTYTLNTPSTTPVTFEFEVYKDAAGAENYDVSENCRDWNNGDLWNATNLTVLQNQ